MKWILSFLLGVLLWYLLTFALGVFIGMTGLIKLPIFYENIGSNFYNLFLYPVGMWLGFKLTGTPFFGTLKKAKQDNEDNKNE
tara:strand:- start:332 stop:580 length:249 start_codon:yes stop_codon:yes gene_type:complete